MKFENLLIKTENNITTISINRPKKLNALNIKTFEEIANAVKLNVLNELTDFNVCAKVYVFVCLRLHICIYDL